jgi:hypothetical protein
VIINKIPKLQPIIFITNHNSQTTTLTNYPIKIHKKISNKPLILQMTNVNSLPMDSQFNKSPNNKVQNPKKNKNKNKIGKSNVTNKV